MANQHFANLGDVWKHLWLAGVIAGNDLRVSVEPVFAGST